MLRTFNCGIGLAVICAAADADAVCRVPAEAMAKTARPIGTARRSGTAAARMRLFRRSSGSRA